MSDIAMVSLYDDNFKHIGESTHKIMTQYASKWGYEFYSFTKLLDESRYAPWNKILYLKQLMEQKPNIKWFFWIDADCVIEKFDMQLELFIDENYDFIVGEEDDGSGPYINAGVFFIRNSPLSITCLEKSWTISIRHWEQGSLWQTIQTLRGYRYKVINRKTFNYYPEDPPFKPVFIKHYAGVKNHNNLDFWKTFKENLDNKPI